MKIVLCGHWNTPAGVGTFPTSASESSAPSYHEALVACARGIAQVAPEAKVEIVPFGPGEAFVAACELGGGEDQALTVPPTCVDARELGLRVRACARDGVRSVIEAGHIASIDVWFSFLAGLSGREVGELKESVSAFGLRQELKHQMTRCREELRECPPLVAATTMRPFSGMASMLAVNPDLSSRSDISMDTAAEWTQALDEADTTAVSALPRVDGVHPRVTALPGSGAGGGIGAIVAACGGQIRDAGEYLAEVTGIVHRLNDAQLCVIIEPYLHSPLLAESYISSVTDACAEHALPTVALGMESSLSRHEAAQWGLHGVMVGALDVDALEDLGRRVAHTWLRQD